MFAVCRADLQELSATLKRVGADFSSIQDNASAAAADSETLVRQVQTFDNFLRNNLLPAVNDQLVASDINDLVKEDTHLIPVLQQVAANPTDASVVAVANAEVNQWADPIQRVAADCDALG
ncbi:hypothetical protein [Acidothermus cellulolyticus]|nr:hypothetical protein [Acidothermus cellulolyticus]